VARRDESFDPRGILAALERNYVAYVLIGGLARVIRGADELTGGVDVCPSLRPNNLERLERALGDLGAKPQDRGRLVLEEALDEEPTLNVRTSKGDLTLVPAPAGTRRGYDDLRRAATREHIGHGLRPSVASVPDLARMTAALGREADVERLSELRRIMEVEVRLPRTLGLEM
jgi:hypothetical protein